MIRDIVLIYITGAVVFFIALHDEFDHGESWVTLLWTILIVAALLKLFQKGVLRVLKMAVIGLLLAVPAFYAQQSPAYILSGWRWHEPDSGLPVVLKLNPAQCPIPDCSAALDKAIAAWNAVPNTALRLVNGGLTDTYGAYPDHVSTVSFGDQRNQAHGQTDPLAFTDDQITNYMLTVTIGGREFEKNIDTDIVFARGYDVYLTQPNAIATILTHELGHLLGFYHNQDPDSIMYCCRYPPDHGLWLGATDLAGIQFLYPLGRTPAVAGLWIGGDWLLHSGESRTMAIVLSSPAVAGGTAVSLSSNRGFLQAPSSATFPQGETRVEFVATTNQIAKAKKAVITASAGGETRTAVVVVIP